MKKEPPRLASIKDIFSDRKPEPIANYKKFSVLLPLLEINNELHLLLQVRAKELNNRPGEISFPGGGLEKNESFQEACIRETSEELNIHKNKIKIFGETDYIITPYSTFLKPFVGELIDIQPEKLNYNKDEVEKIFTVPLKFFLSNPPGLYYIYFEPKFSDEFPFDRIPGEKKYPFKAERYPVYFYRYNNYNIWGLTARIINNFVKIIS